jgi:hypothetical protein
VTQHSVGTGVDASLTAIGVYTYDCESPVAWEKVR